MARVDRTGTFRFNKVLEAGVSITKTSEYPSFNVRLALSEFYDETERQWVPWEEYGMEVSAYLCLFGMDKKKKQIGPTLNHQQVMKVFGWDGKSFQILANDDYSVVTGQIRIKDNDPEYADNNPYQVAFIDVFDADPSSQLRKLEADDLKKLDAKFASVLQASGSAPKPVSAPAKPKVGPKLPVQPGPKVETASEPINEIGPEATAEAEAIVETPAQKKANINAKAKKLAAAKKAAAASKKPGPPARTPTPAPPAEAVVPEAEPVKGITKQEAWEICVEMKSADCDDDTLGSAWNAAIDLVTGGIPDDDDITPDQWAEIKDVTLDEIGAI